MEFLSVCSGIEAASVAWPTWKCVGVSEIEKFPSAVLEHRHPGVTNYGDMNDFRKWPEFSDLDVLVGGTPCQSFSIAGLRQGMADPRGNLALVYVAMVERYRPTWFIWENVPGVLSSHKGRDFGSFIGAMAELGYGCAWRVLDAQYFGVPQRRRRVFVVGHIGDWRRAAEVLFEPACMRGYPSPRRSSGTTFAGDIAGCPDVSSTLGSISGGQRPDPACTYIPEVTGALSDGAHNGGGLNGQDVYAHRLIAQEVANPLTSRMHKGINSNVCEGQTPIVSFNWQNGGGYGDANDGLGIGEDHAGPCLTSQVQAIAFKPGQSAEAHTLGESDEVACTLEAGGGGNNRQAVAFAQNQRDEVVEKEVAGALAADAGAKQQSYVRQGVQVRRLTPLECERLQGFPDGYTAIPGAKDSPRYRALGNTMAVPVMAWIGKRIEENDRRRA